MLIWSFFAMGFPIAMFEWLSEVFEKNLEAWQSAIILGKL